jgi:hypothetical protein
MRTLISRARPDHPRSATLPLLALLAVTAPPAGAESVIFDLDTGNLSTGSGVALGGNSVFGLYPDGATIPVEVAAGPSSATLAFDLDGAGIPDAVESLSGSRFAFTLLSATPVSLTLDFTTGEINAALDDPQVAFQVEQFAPGGIVPVATTTATMDLSTATMQVPGGCDGPDRTGLPLEPLTGQVTLRGLACVEQLGSSADMVFDLKLTGRLPVPEASATGLGAAALASLGALVRRCARAAREAG